MYKNSLLLSALLCLPNLISSSDKKVNQLNKENALNLLSNTEDQSSSSKSSNQLTGLNLLAEAACQISTKPVHPQKSITPHVHITPNIQKHLDKFHAFTSRSRCLNPTLEGFRRHIFEMALPCSSQESSDFEQACAIIASNNSNDEQSSKKSKTSHDFRRNNSLEETSLNDGASFIPGIVIGISQESSSSSAQPSKPIKHPLQITWNENEANKDTHGFDISCADDKKIEITAEGKKYQYTSKKGVKNLPNYISKEILTYLFDFSTDTSCKEAQDASHALKSSLRDVNGTRFINCLQKLRLCDKIQSIQEPYLPTKPHSFHLNDHALLESLCNPKTLIHQSIKDSRPNFSSSIAPSSCKIYQTDDEKQSHYTTFLCMMKMLLKNGVDPNSYVQNTETGSMNKYMQTPLCFAATCNKDYHGKHDAIAEKSSCDLTNLLLQYKANSNKKSYFLNENLATPKHLYQTPLHYAVKNDNEEVTQALVTHRFNKKSLKIDVNSKDSHGNTPLHLATQKNNLKIVKSLLDADAQRDTENKHKEIPLHLVPKISTIGCCPTRNLQELDIVHEKAMGITRLLLEKDANKQKTALNHWNKTPVDIARQCAEQKPNGPEYHDIDQRKISFQKNFIDTINSRP